MWNAPPSKILVPVDFSEASGRAVAVAAALAARVRAEMLLLHVEVLEVPAYFTHEQQKTLERERNLARSNARSFMEDFARRHGATRFTSRIAEGLPTAVIVEAAAGADMVVMGTHGRRGPARWWIGSVAERVIHASPTPVLVVRAEAAPTPAEAPFFHPMVVAVASAEDEPARRVADSLAAAFGGRVADAAASCQADLARDRQATLIVMAHAARHGGVLAHPAEHWLRTCSLPMVFVPIGVSKTPGPESLDHTTHANRQGGLS